MSFVISAVTASQSFMFWSVVVLGACVGSFLNVCILRIPEKTFLSTRGLYVRPVELLSHLI